MENVITPNPEMSIPPASAEVPYRNGAAAANGTEAHHTEHSAEQPAHDEAPNESTRVDRAEVIVDRVVGHVAQFTSFWSRRVLRAASRIREQAQDMWAEAQSVRRGDQE